MTMFEKINIWCFDHIVEIAMIGLFIGGVFGMVALSTKIILM